MSFPFSNRTLVRLADAIEQGNSHTTMDALFFECSVESWEDPTASTKLAKALNLLKSMQSDASPAACRGARDLMTEVLKRGKPSGWSNYAASWYQPLTGALVADGLEFEEVNRCAASHRRRS